MSRFNHVMFTGMFLATAGIQSSIAAAESLTAIDADRMFIPKGFDDNDHVEVVLDGYMPSTCYKQAEPSVMVDMDAKTITVTPQAKLYEGPCLLVLVPFTEIANLGTLPKGEYKIIGGTRFDSQVLKVAQSTNAGPDDYLYAPVDSIKVTVMPESQSIELEIRGRFTNTCMTSDKVIVNDSKDTLEVQPLIKMADREDCHESEFVYKPMVTQLPWRQVGRYLAHVRSLNGKSVNEVFSVYGE